MRPSSETRWPRYLATVAAAMAATFTLVWVWVAAMPLAYLDPEYPVWRAKQLMLRNCDLGDVLVLGDSRAAVDIRPALLPMKVTNLAVGGGEPIEAYAVLSRALACPMPPRRVVISLGAAHFTEPDLLWERTIRFGFLDASDIADLRAAVRETGDDAFAGPKHPDGIPERLRAWLYTGHFPPLYFSSLVRGGLFLRFWRNQATFDATLAARGQYFFGQEDGSSVVAVEGHMPAFVPLRVLDLYFDRMLRMLADRGTPVDFVAMPMNHATRREVRPQVHNDFAAYLAGYEARYPNFHVVGKVMPEWPDRYFGDGFAHLNPQGVVLLNPQLAECLQVRLDSGAPRSDCSSR